MKKWILSSMIIILIACKWDQVEMVAPDCDDEYTYESHAESIIVSTCSKNSDCHANGSTYGVFGSYDAVKTYLDGGNFQVQLNTGLMPPAGHSISDQDKLILQCWIEAGYPEKN